MFKDHCFESALHPHIEGATDSEHFYSISSFKRPQEKKSDVPRLTFVLFALAKTSLVHDGCFFPKCRK